MAIVIGVLDYLPRLSHQTRVVRGDMAPAFVLETATGERVDIADHQGRQALLLVFIPGYRCSSCRVQLQKLDSEVERMTAVGALVLVIGDDAILDAKRIAADVSPGVRLLIDRTFAVAHRYGMNEPGRPYSLAGYVVVDRRGRVLAHDVDPMFGDHRAKIARLVHEAANVDE